MKECGYIAISRDILDHPLVGAKKPYSECEAWIWLLLEAAWKPRDVRVSSNGRARAIIHLQRGQLTHSLRFMAKAWGWSPDRVGRYLAWLKSHNQIETPNATPQKVISICNYERYQTADEKSRQQTRRQRDSYKDKEEEAKESKVAASAASPLSEEADLFRRGKEILGDTSGGLITKLLRAKDKSIPLARAAIETAATKHDPREYLGACIRGADPERYVDPRL